MSYNMIRKGIIILLLTTVCICVLLVEGCTVIGFTTGAIIDGNKAPVKEIDSISKWKEIKSGSKVSIIKNDEEKIIGKFLSFRPMPLEQAKKQYDKWFGNLYDSANSPAFGDTVILKRDLDTGQEFRGCFLGFYIDAMLIKKEGRDFLEVLPLADIYEIKYSNGKVLKGNSVMQSISNRELPISMEVELQIWEDAKYLPVMNIKRIDIISNRNAKWYGALIGLAFDIPLILLIISHPYIGIVD